VSKTPLFIKLARPTYGAYLLRRNRIETIGMENLSNLEGPCLVFGNHGHAMDSFFVSAAAPVHIRWVAGAYLFKLRGVKTMLASWIGGISKQQGRSDLHTIRAISNALKKGDKVGLFPEGTRTWDGEPVGFDESTAKLARMFKVPVVIVNIEGNYFLKPRWTTKPRKGTVTIRVFPPLMPETIAKMSLGQLHAVLSRDLGFSHSKWQEAQHRPFRNNALAQGLEQVLYICPSCNERSTLRSHKDLITCSHCGMTARLDPFEQFSPVKGTLPFPDIPKWHRWETDQLARLLSTAPKGTPLFPPDRGVLIQIGLGSKLVTLTRHFNLTLTPEGLTVHRQDRGGERFLGNKKTLCFPFDHIQSIIVNAKSTIEMYRDGELYRIRIDRRSSILKYIESYEITTKKQHSSSTGVHT
jgi:1-acyl-sn-glycerol-3-phosphate acyltransferase